VAFAKLYTSKHAITSADVLNDRVLPFFDIHEIPMVKILTDSGTEFNGRPENHEYELYLQIEGIDHSKTKVRHPQSNGICERLHRTMQEEFYAITFRKKLYQDLDTLQADLDQWLSYYNNERPHSGRYCSPETDLPILLLEVFDNFDQRVFITSHGWDIPQPLKNVYYITSCFR
jgi:hypothetical protein